MLVQGGSIVKLNVYCIFDRVAEEGGPVWTAKTDAVAVRNARITLKDVRADEYRMYCLGVYDTDSVCLIALKESREVVIPQDVGGIDNA
jgi:hypothetical protein